MGSGAGGFVTIQVNTTRNIPSADGLSLVRTSQLIFTPADTPNRSLPPIPNDPGPVPGNPPAGKVALGGLKQADVTQFNLYAYTDKQLTKLMGMGTAPSSAIATEASTAFGGDWAGFAVALGPAGGRFNLVADLILLPHWTGQAAVKPFRVIPVVVAFGTDSFINHYLLSLIVAQKTPDLVDTAVSQPYR